MHISSFLKLWTSKLTENPLRLIGIFLKNLIWKISHHHLSGFYSTTDDRKILFISMCYKKINFGQWFEIHDFEGSNILRGMSNQKVFRNITEDLAVTGYWSSSSFSLLIHMFILSWKMANCFENFCISFWNVEVRFTVYC